MISANTSIGPRGSQSRTSTGTQDKIIRANRMSRKIQRIQSMICPTKNTMVPSTPGLVPYTCPQPTTLDPTRLSRQSTLEDREAGSPRKHQSQAVTARKQPTTGEQDDDQ